MNRFARVWKFVLMAGLALAALRAAASADAPRALPAGATPNDSRLGPLKVPDTALGSVSYPVSDGGAQCTVATRSVEARFSWDGETLPHLQLWGDLSPDKGVLSIEPCTSERLDGGLSGEDPLLAPGATRRYELQISLAGPP